MVGKERQSTLPTRSSSRLKPPSANAPPIPPTTSSRPTRSKPTVPAATTIVAPKPTRKATASVEKNETATQLQSQTTNDGPIQKGSLPSAAQIDTEREPIKTFLRIRPPPSGTSSTLPYLTNLTPTSVTLVDLASQQSGISRLRPPENKSSTFKFTQVFPPETPQAEFFTSTTLPLVENLLQGENGLIFAYGVTNSGKTFTIQGGKEPGQGGILLRTLDVVFNSLEGLQSNAPLRPVKLASVEVDPDILASPPVIEDLTQDTPDTAENSNVNQDILAQLLPELFDTGVTEQMSIAVDKNYEYAVWVSYAEIYQEKIFDLLDFDVASTTPASSLSKGGSQGLSRWNTGFSLSSLGSSSRLSSAPSKSRLSNNFATLLSMHPQSHASTPTITRKTLRLAMDTDAGSKYILGQKEVRVRSAQEAKEIITQGQISRKVFGTHANAESSRSHAIFTLKVIKIHKAAKEDPDSVIVSRLSIVDLAGSERVKNTQSSGERLKEGASINKSLMTLGLCMDTMRKNQHRLMDYLSGLKDRGHSEKAGSSSTKTGLGIKNSLIAGALGTAIKFDSLKSKVPFIYSRLTELFQDFFEGDGRAVMILNLNPYTTGYDENIRVMDFAASTSEVTVPTTKNGSSTTVIKPARSTPTGPVHQGRLSLSTRTVTVAAKTSIGSVSPTPNALTSWEVAEINDDDEEDSDDNQLIDKLFQVVEDLKEKLYDAELRYAMAEVTIREQVAQEYEERMQEMEETFRQRRNRDAQDFENKLDKKIDLLSRAGVLSKRKISTIGEVDDDEQDVENSLTVDDDDSAFREDVHSPTANMKGKARAQPSGPTPATRTDSDLAELRDEESDSADTPETETDEEWDPTTVRSQDQLDAAMEAEEVAALKASLRKSATHIPVNTKNSLEEGVVGPSKSRKSHQKTSTDRDVRISAHASAAAKKTLPLVQNPLQLPPFDQSMDDIMVVPVKRARDEKDSQLGSSDNQVSSLPDRTKISNEDNVIHDKDVGIARKKKRQLGKKAALTEAEIWEVANKIELASSMGMAKGVRRMA